MQEIIFFLWKGLEKTLISIVYNLLQESLYILNHQNTTRFHSFTDGNIPSVCDSVFVGFFLPPASPTENVRRLSFHRYYLIPLLNHSVKKINICQWFYRQKLRAKKKVSRLKYTDGFIPSVIVWNIDGISCR